MNDSWFFENFNGVSDEFFDDVIKYLDFPLEDLEPNEDWNEKFQSIEPPLGILSELSSDFSSTSSKLPKSNSTPYSRALQLKQEPSIADTPSSGSTLVCSDSNDVKDVLRFQSSSPVSVLGTSSSSSAENPAPVINPKLVFPVKRTRSKCRRPRTFNPQFIFPIPVAESEFESHLAEKCRRKKLKKNLTVLSGTREIKKPYFKPSVPTRKCTHCEVTQTPQWREGPFGPKTLCNACGVRYRSGRLVPEYRPAASPTFVPSMHSNSHKRILEMRNKVWQ